MLKISGHYECASMINKNIQPLKGPKKSVGILLHGLLGHCQGVNGVFAVFRRDSIQILHEPVILSISSPKFGHQK